MFDMKKWSKEFFENANQLMSKEVASIFTNLIMAERKQNMNFESVKKEFLFQLIDKRAEFIGLKMSDAVKVFLMYLSQSPGSAVMYIYAIRSKTTNVDMQILAELFDVGFLSEKALTKMWDAQKGSHCGEKIDNCLDGYIFEKA